MIDYISGTIAELTPTEVVIDNGGIGYSVNIALPTYALLTEKKEVKLYVYEVIREDAHQLYGFVEKRDRELFLLLIGVSGVGANTARVIMSSLTPQELRDAIVRENSRALKNVKGIGTKTAERIVVDLKDKVGKLKIEGSAPQLPSGRAAEAEEAVEALVMLGFGRPNSVKAVEKAMQQNPQAKVGEVVKIAMRLM
ncbi:MAG: Holliday junction branch migration protein RuvA [Paludibacteraceae bacterium]|nr:Holliday junction branch migration protein RuvA [Paludibacteraceae bacterium]